MAAALIPVLTSLIPMIVPSVISLVEKALGRKGGDKKMETAKTILDAIFRAIEQRNPGNALPVGGELAQLIQQTVDQMNKVGTLNGVDTDVSMAASTMSAEAKAATMQILEGSLRLMKSMQ